MEGKPLQEIRETTRRMLKVSRQVHKDELTDVRRSIQTARITPDTIADIANRLKNKTAVSLSELHTLKNTLIEDEKNIDIVLGTQGSLRGLVRELSGQDVKRQSAAAGCLCNLALGDSKSCVAVAKAAGPYLVTTLDNLSAEIAVTCAWTIGNMAGSGPRACAVLSAQGAVAKLAALLASRDERSQAAVYALVHFTGQMKDEFSKEYIEKIVEAYPNLDTDVSTNQLLFNISCHEEFNINQLDLTRKLLDSISVSTEKHFDACAGSESCYNLTYLLRTLANISVTKVNSDFVVNYINNKRLLSQFKRILASNCSTVKESLLWFIGNFYNSCSDNSFVREVVS